MPRHSQLTAADVERAWKLLNPAAGSHLSQLELSQNGESAVPSFTHAEAGNLTGPSSLLTLQQLQSVLESADLEVSTLQGLPLE